MENTAQPNDNYALAMAAIQAPQGRRRVAGEYKGGLTPHKLRRLLWLIEENLEGDLRLAQLAGAVGLNRFHLLRTFKQETGLAPHQFVLRRRVEEAKRLLSGTGLPIAEVSYRVGFSSQSHFTKVFRRLVGFTPRAYRRAC